jgi:hypothetical protein
MLIVLSRLESPDGRRRIQQNFAELGEPWRPFLAPSFVK